MEMEPVVFKFANHDPCCIFEVLPGASGSRTRDAGHPG
jgi:hypothetical protein